MQQIDWRALFGSTLDTPRDAVVALGIDLGTTYSTVTRIAWTGDPDDEPELDVVPIRQRTSAGSKRSALVPSVVSVRADGTTAVGEEARDVVRERGRPPREGMDTFTATKNDIGTRKQYPKAPEHLNSPAKVAEHILRFLVAGAQEAYPGRFDRVVVTVPASFQLTQREDTAKAALESGIDLKAYDLMDEPVAAFLTYAAQRAEGVAAGRYMVLDVGGGTSDVALLSVEPTHGQVQVIPVGAGPVKSVRRMFLTGPDRCRA